MFAVVKTGGKQYKVAESDILKVEKLPGSEGDVVTFDQVLMLSGGAQLKTGTPLVEGAVVTAEILEQTRGDKVIVFKKRRRHTFRKRNGHRQYLSVIKITGVGTPGPKGSAKKVATKKAPPAETDTADEAPASQAAADADDLKKLSGVGPALEKKLIAAGITSFQDILDLTAEKRDEIETELKISGRMEKDDWAGQAKQFLAEKEQ